MSRARNANGSARKRRLGAVALVLLSLEKERSASKSNSTPLAPADLRKKPAAPAVRVDGEVEDVQLVLVQLIDHEADDLFALLSDHADAVALAQTAEEVLLGPGVVEAGLLGLQDLGHVAANHPANVHADLF